MRPGSSKSGAQRRVLDTQPRQQVRAELRAVRLTSRAV
jgi:hypothetical protein